MREYVCPSGQQAQQNQETKSSGGIKNNSAVCSNHLTNYKLLLNICKYSFIPFYPWSGFPQIYARPCVFLFAAMSGPGLIRHRLMIVKTGPVMVHWQ